MEKFFLKSKTIIGLIVTLIPTIATLFGVSLTDDDQALIGQSADALIQLIGLSIAAYGRITATEKLSVKNLK